jgi:hypothetical protein
MSASNGINQLAVLESAVVIFMLGGLWYSPVLFAKRWVALQGRSMEEMRAMSTGPIMYVEVFICGLLTALVLAVVIEHYGAATISGGALVGALCWVGFAGATSYGSSLFSFKPKALWAIDSGYNLVSFVVAGAILALWH